MNIKCFWLEETSRAKIELRRYKSAPYDYETNTSPRNCPGPGGYHDNEVDIDEREVVWDESGHFEPIDGHKFIGSINSSVPHDDPRWPAKCRSCDYVFVETDVWQVNQHLVYRRADTGEEMTLGDIRGSREAGTRAGAMWDAWWMHSFNSPYRVGPDGVCLMVMTPAGEWCVDGPASNGSPDNPGWIRTGTIPDITATPSILVQWGAGYHGWLRDGHLVDA